MYIFTANRRKVFNLEENGVAGHPDGMTIDSEDNLWIACFDGGQVGISDSCITLLTLGPCQQRHVSLFLLFQSAKPWHHSGLSDDLLLKLFGPVCMY
jgi:hypothetical protein